MTSNIDILVGNQMAQMYSENENTFMDMAINDMFDEMKEDEKG